MTHSAVERNIDKQLKRAGQKSEAIANKPKLIPGLQIFLDAFYELQTERIDGGLIPVTKILQYADSWGLRPQLKQMMVTLIRSMDLALRKHNDAKAEKDKKRGVESADTGKTIRTPRVRTTAKR